MNKHGLDITPFYITFQLSTLLYTYALKNYYEMYSQKTHFKSRNAFRLNRYLSDSNCGRMFGGITTQSIYSPINNAGINKAWLNRL